MENDSRLVMDNIVYDIRWTSELDEKFICDFLYIQNEVFKCGTRQEFKRQYEENIYGESILVVVYLDKNPVAARGLWRNDLNGKEAYQPGSTCVLPICRGKGIFTEMTKRAINLLPTDVVIYNFPNSNSYPGYIKMGWHLVRDYKIRLYSSYSQFVKEHPIMLDYRYAKWWLVGKPLTYTYIRGHYFLLQKDRRTFCYRILAEVDKETALLFSRCKLGIIFYKSIRTTWYNKLLASSHVVSKNLNIDYIPTWKIDAV